MTAPIDPMQALNDEAEPHEELDPYAETTEAAPPHPSGQRLGWWLECTPKEAVLGIKQIGKQQQPYRRWRAAQEEVWERYRAGERGLTVEARAQDQDYYVRRGYEAGRIDQSVNRADQLLHRRAAVLTTDPPVPTINANSDAPNEREASALAERILRVEGQPVERDDPGFFSESIDLGGTYGSMIAYFCVLPNGGGLKPVQIQAYPQSTTTKDALTPMHPMGTIDPTTGADVSGQPMPVDESQLTWRYVTVQDTLTDVQAEARLSWQPYIARRLLRPANVLFLPFGADAASATGVLVGELIPLSEVVSRFYDGERPDAETCKKLADWKPTEFDWRLWVPPEQRERLPVSAPTRPSETSAADPELTDDALCPIVCAYWRSCAEAPLGAYVVVGGLPEPLKRDTMQVTFGEGEDARTDLLDLPVAQFTDWKSALGDPMGVPGLVQLIPESNIDATLTQYALNYLWRASNPHVWAPAGTAVQQEAFKARTGDLLHYSAAGGVPTYESIPSVDHALFEYQQKTQDGLQASTGLASGVATGDQDANITSGLQQRLVSEESRTGLSQQAQHRDKYAVMCWTILIQMIRAYYTTPQELSYTGEAGDVQRESFLGVELDGAGDIQIQKGSGTMLSPAAKSELTKGELQLAMELQKGGIASGAEAVERYHEQLMGNQGPLVGLQDDPRAARIARQIQQWTDAAKQGGLPAPIPEPPPPVDPMTGQPGPPQPPTDPVSIEAAKIFSANPTDVIPITATMRYRKLSDMIASKAFATADQRYQAAAVAEFERMRAAAGIMTIAEQQAAAQQQQQAAQQAEQAKAAAAAQAKIQEIDAKKSADPLPGVPATAEGLETARAPIGPPDGQGFPA